MEVDVAVLGGGPAGYTAAIRAAQLGGKVACIEQEPTLGGTCLRVGLHPDEGLGADRARAPRRARDRSRSSACWPASPTLDFAQANEWKDAVVKQMTGGVASLFKANGVDVGPGRRARFEDARTRSPSTGDEDVSFKSAIVATGSFPMRPPIPGLDSPRCVDSTGLLAQTEVPRRLVVLGGGIIGCEFASIFERFGTEVTIVEMLDAPHPAGGRGRGEASSGRRSRKRGIVVHLGKQCTKVEDTRRRI